MKRISRLVVLGCLLALTLAACGGGGVDEDDGDTVTTTAAGDDGATTLTTVADDGDMATCEVGETDGDLNFYNWTEYIDPELVDAFEEEFGVAVVEDFYDSNEALLARLQSGAVYDLIVPSDYMIAIMIEEGLLMELQRDAIPNVTNLAPFFADPPFDPGGTYSAAYQWGTTGLGVNMDVVGEDFEPSWALVFDPELVAEYPGGISLLNDPRETMGAALMYLGYSMNSVSEAELQEAADVIAGVRDQIAAFDSDTYAELLVNGEVAVSHGFSGGYLTAIEDWETHTYVIPQEGATVWTDNMAIPTNADHPCTAHAFINFLLDAENGAALTNWNYYASPNEASEEFIDPDILEDEAVYPSDEVFANLVVIEDTGDFEINYTDYFAQARS
ncbi:MAG TPA: spermidine/putrescine ABC transporter substrate-binding protein [Acidimicrobiia bacterium]|nr:spermidine/putrescine ABC transporter substrate-binding protein [Acidimicrobiia bacterium]